ncbi:MULTISPECIES: hypothetical protein [unclassified Microbacterium]|uniref:hypothetical protein n=1 Tax=unclassified Microbacterium TaxID=2609290 RepID=UPI0030196C2B
MPVITVATAPHPAERELLVAIADAAADALGLAAGDVIAMTMPVRTTVANGQSSDAAAGAWMLVSIHGSDRGADGTRRACDAVRAAAADWSRRHAAERENDADLEGVWCEWLLPEHP